MSAKHEWHPFADEFPLMSDAEFKALKKDIEENGLREPIYLFEEKILDGRNRQRACLELGIKPRFRVLKISREKARTLTVSENLQRRHLTKSQQAMYIVQAGLLGRGGRPGRKRTYRTGDSSIRRIGKRYGVSHVSIYKAMFICENDRDNLAARVLKGELSVAKAEKIIRDGETKSEPSIRDSLGQKVPRKLQELFRLSGALDNDDAQLTRVRDQLGNLPEVLKTAAAKAQKHVQIAIDTVVSMRPYAVCRNCSGKGCTNCGGKGWQSQAEWKRANGAA